MRRISVQSFRMQSIRVQSLIKKTFLTVFVIVLCFLSVSCGESVSYSAAPPSDVISPTPADPSQNLFRFTTAEDLNTTGTSVYYRIYTDESKLLQDQSAIMNQGTDSNYQPRINKMNSLGYRLINGAERLIPATNANRFIEIRLSDETSFTAGIVVAGTATGIPSRFSYGNFKFSNSYYPHTNETDFDGTQTSAGPWYVAAFACSVISENGVSAPQLGPLRYLGYVRISY